MPPYTPPDAPEERGRRELIVALAVILVAWSTSFLPDASQEFIASNLRDTALLPFVSLQRGLTSAQARAVRNEELQARLDSTVAALTARTTLEEENRRLRGLLGLSERLGPRWHGAQVLRPGTQGSRSIFLLDVGTDDGIARRSPVMTREGLAGQVLEVQESQAIGMDWTHPDFRASAMTEDGLYYGMVESRQFAFREEDRLLLTTAFNADLPPGTVLVTSGLGGVFPRGVPIGRVVELFEAEGRWRKSWWIQPFVQVASLTQVLVAEPVAADTADLRRIFGADGYGTAAELLQRDSARADSLQADSVAADSARVDSAQADSARADSSAGGVPRTAPAGGEGGGR